MKFVNRLKLLRKEKKLTQKQLSISLDIPLRTLQSWENGESNIKYDYVENIADYFKVSASYLLGLSEKRTSYEDETQDKKDFITFLKNKSILLSDKQIDAIYEMIQSSNLHNDDNLIGSFFNYDLTMFRSSEDIYNEMAKEGYSYLVNDLSSINDNE